MAATKKIPAPQTLSGGKVISRGSSISKGMPSRPANFGVNYGMPPRPVKFGVNPGTYTPTPSSASSVSVPGPTVQPSTPDIRDPAYWLDTANIGQYYGTQKATIGAQHDTDKAALDRAMTILGEKLPEDLRVAKENANKSGLFYSTTLGRNLGDIETSYSHQRENLTGEYTGRENLRNIASGDLEATYGPGGLKYREAANNALDRQTARDAANQPQGAPDAGSGSSQAQLVSQIVQNYPSLSQLPKLKPKKPGTKGLGWG